MKKYIMNIYNDPIVSNDTMEIMRQRRYLEEDDSSEDMEILNMSPRDFLDEMLGWKGIIGYTDDIIDMIYEAYGVDLNLLEDKEYEREV